ncbi:hypothetical protein NDA11_004292 [Ustilago hordei]|uniref:Uncharacterized protein n=1 Tax=Ustilago hordei TaxID=120017 RepID=I2FQK3_USTHO|nr:hypothetical protein NDA10_006860 [Ustilago hordei]KAJ1596078.1 hypothetical protein NDA11_004292 [Ustilago hordei]CCF49196.1 uncharacterized protein UHOR_13583 [Ustilago hordei]
MLRTLDLPPDEAGGQLDNEPKDRRMGEMKGGMNRHSDEVGMAPVDYEAARELSVIGLEAQKQKPYEKQKSHEEECRNQGLGKSRGLQQSSLRSVVERLYDRSHPDWHK